MSTGNEFEIERVGILNPHPTIVDAINPGEVGYFAAQIKTERMLAIRSPMRKSQRRNHFQDLKSLNQPFCAEFFQPTIQM